jgi:hypothetical protein
MLLLAPSVLRLGRLAGSRSVDAVATVTAIAAIVAGVANLLEDGLGMKGLGASYVADARSSRPSPRCTLSGNTDQGRDVRERSVMDVARDRQARWHRSGAAGRT